jgi:hypothetical protein
MVWKRNRTIGSSYSQPGSADRKVRPQRRRLLKMISLQDMVMAQLNGMRFKGEDEQKE